MECGNVPMSEYPRMSLGEVCSIQNEHVKNDG